VRRSRLATFSGTLLATTLLTACGLLSPIDTETTSALLDKLPAQVPRERCAPAVLAVLRPEARPVYDTAQMAYTQRAHQLAYFTRHQWAETPAQMLHPLLVRTLERTGCFSAVLPATGSATHVLRTEVVELVQDFTQDPPVLRLSLRLRLSREGAGRAIAQRDVVMAEPMRQKGPLGGVDAANDAVARALQDAAAFVLEQMR
jgi:cholesterol transport system auxiliary component